MVNPEFKVARAANDKHWFSKMVIRIIQVVVIIISLAVTTAATWYPYGNGNFGGAELLLGVWIYFVIFWIATLAWNAGHFIRIGTHERPIHPGVVVGIDLVLSLAYIIASAFGFASFASSLVLRSQVCNDPSQFDDFDGNEFDAYDSYFLAQCQAINSSLYIAGTIFFAFPALFLFITHLYLFVRGCIDTHRRRRARYQGVQMMPMNGGYVNTAYQPGMQVPYAQHPAEGQQPQANYTYVPAKQ